MSAPLLSRLVYGLVRLFYATYRFRLVGAAPDRGPDGRGGYVLAIWHQNLFAGILAQTGHRHTVIVSRSRDGDAVSYLCSRLGHHVARGSSKKRGIDKGGKEAKDEMIEVLRSGIPGAVTVDGPSGPAHEVKPGIVEMARQAGIPVVPYLALPASYWSFRSWDAFRLPKPFTRIDVCYGAPQHVAPDTGFDQFPRFQQAIAEALQTLEREQLERRAKLPARFSRLASLFR